MLDSRHEVKTSAFRGASRPTT